MQRILTARQTQRAPVSQTSSVNDSCSHTIRPLNSNFQTARISTPRQHRIVIVRSWQQVIDQASGKPYYWNTATNETVWELPAGATAVNTTSSNTATATATADKPQQQQQQQQEASTMSFDSLYAVLQEAYTADGSGMQFWEVARAHRQYGVFDVPFFEFLEHKQKQLAGVDEAGKDMAFKIMCRLSNPLLRQPAPFEF